MDPLTLQFPAVAPAPVPNHAEIDRLKARFSSVYRISQTSAAVFASPLGPFYFNRRPIWLPRVVFCAPHASDASWRVALFAALDHRDLRSTHGLLSVIESLAANADHGHGLNLAFFPLVDAAGLAVDAPDRTLIREDWAKSKAPEVKLLRQDIRARGYHAFVRLETASPSDELPTLSIRASTHVDSATPDVEIFSSDAFEAIDLKYERVTAGAGASFGPLDLAEDLGVQPFELTLRIPPRLSDAEYEATATYVVTRVLQRYRAFQAYGGEL